MEKRAFQRTINSDISGLHTKEEQYNPYHWYKSMREKTPIYFDKQGIWNVFSYEDVNKVLSDKDVFSSDTVGVLPFPNILNMGPPNHTRLRSLVNKAFTPKMVDNL